MKPLQVSHQQLLIFYHSSPLLHHHQYHIISHILSLIFTRSAYIQHDATFSAAVLSWGMDSELETVLSQFRRRSDDDDGNHNDDDDGNHNDDDDDGNHNDADDSMYQQP